MGGKHFLAFHDGESWVICDLDSGVRLRTPKIRSTVPVGTADGATFRDKIADAPAAALRITGTVLSRGDGSVIFTQANQANQSARPTRRARSKSRSSGRTACVHRGDQVSTIGCEACGGKTVQIAVYECEKHGECTPGQNSEAIRACSDCGDYRPATESASEPASGRTALSSPATSRERSTA